MNGKKYNVLFVEDDIEVRRNYLEYLKIIFNQTFQAGDGITGLEIFKKEDIHFIITDISMPKMDGLSFVEKVRSFDHKVPIVILTAHSESDKLLQALKLSLIDYIIKPISRQSFKSSISRALSVIRKNFEHDLIYFFKDHKLESIREALFKNDEKIILTKLEKKLLFYLCENANNKYVSQIDIFNGVWENEKKEFNTASVRNLVKSLRKKLPNNTIENTYGEGYKIIIDKIENSTNKFKKLN